MARPSISYAPRSDTTPETELSALCNVYKLIIDHANRRNAISLTNTNGTSVRNTEEVSDVGQRPD
jgi:hypothetical protein